MRGTLVSRKFLLFLPSDDIEALRSLSLRSFSKPTLLITANQVYQPNNSLLSTTPRHSSIPTSQTTSTVLLQHSDHENKSCIKDDYDIDSDHDHEIITQHFHHQHHPQWITFALVFLSRWHPACLASQDHQSPHLLLHPLHSRLPGAPTSSSQWSSQSRPSLHALRTSRLHAPSRPTSDLVDLS